MRRISYADIRSYVIFTSTDVTWCASIQLQQFGFDDAVGPGH